MKKTEKPINYPLSIFIFACVIYSIFNVIFSFLLTRRNVVLEVWANLLIYTLIFIVSAIVVLSKKLVLKSFILKASTVIYTVLSVILNIVFAIISSISMWHWTTVVLLVVYSIAVSLLLAYLKLNSYLLRTLIYYVISIASFYLLTNVIGGYTAGNTTIMLFGIFTLTYIVGSVIYFYIKRSFFAIENEEQEYKKQFD